MSIKTVKVSNVSLTVSEKDIKEFFSFSGDIQYVDMQKETENTQLAYVTFKESQGADTATLLSGATIADLSVSIEAVENYQLPPSAPLSNSEIKPNTADSAVKKAEDVVSTMLAKGFVLGKDALNKAKSFDEHHHFTLNASATVATIDRTIGLSEKLSIGQAVVNEKVKEMDEWLQVSERTKSAFAAAEQKASIAGSAIISNPYVSTGALWVTCALSAFAKAAEDVSMMTKEKLEKAEEEKREILHKERAAMVEDFARLHLDESLLGDPQAAKNSADGEATVNDLAQVHIDESSTGESKAATASDLAKVHDDESSAREIPAMPVISADTAAMANDLAQRSDETLAGECPVVPHNSADKVAAVTELAQGRLGEPSATELPAAPVNSADKAATVHLDESSTGKLPVAPANSVDDSKLPII